MIKEKLVKETFDSIDGLKKKIVQLNSFDLFTKVQYKEVFGETVELEKKLVKILSAQKVFNLNETP